MDIIIITGLSGAGKSHAIHYLEDMDYYCIDNIPPFLMKEFVSLASENGSRLHKIAFVMDIRGSRFFGDFMTTIEELQAEPNINVKVLFLEASDSVLVRRYKETRRQHPLDSEGDVRKAIAQERKMLEPIRAKATHVLDTSSIKPQALNAELKRLVSSEKEGDSFTVTVMSFGFKHGVPQEADWVLDARFIPNPFYLGSLKKLTGRNKKVKEYVLKFPETRDFIKRVENLITDLVPMYRREGKSNLVVAIGCTGGQHRSVVVADALAEALQPSGMHVVHIDRELN